MRTLEHDHQMDGGLYRYAGGSQGALVHGTVYRLRYRGESHLGRGSLYDAYDPATGTIVARGAAGYLFDGHRVAERAA